MGFKIGDLVKVPAFKVEHAINKGKIVGLEHHLDEYLGGHIDYDVENINMFNPLKTSYVVAYVDEDGTISADWFPESRIERF